MDLLRITTAGSVDDGKSTLIGRLLYENNVLTEEQEQRIARESKQKGLHDLDFSILTDGLIAEREQGITIDVAHIYFSTKSRKFIIADSPGHIEYTRNMVTGASNAQLSIILIDARKGLLEQSYRHFFISHLLQIEHVIFCINKMDLVDYSEQAYETISAQIQTMTEDYQKDKSVIHIVPISSLKGDNITVPSANTKWYKGWVLNDILHRIDPAINNDNKFRMDVQNVVHVQQDDDFVDFRGYAGRISSGQIRVEDTITILPSQKTAVVQEIRMYKDTFESANAKDSVVIRLDKDIDISRGAMFVKQGEEPKGFKQISATIVWLDEKELKKGDKFIIQSGVKQIPARVSEIHFVIPPENPSNQYHSEILKLNDIAKIDLQLSQILCIENYTDNKGNGSFILIDPNSNNTSAVGFVEIS